jgi:hypothetical protein
MFGLFLDVLAKVIVDKFSCIHYVLQLTLCIILSSFTLCLHDVHCVICDDASWVDLAKCVHILLRFSVSLCNLSSGSSLTTFSDLKVTGLLGC